MYSLDFVAFVGRHTLSSLGQLWLAVRISTRNTRIHHLDVRSFELTCTLDPIPIYSLLRVGALTHCILSLTGVPMRS